MSATDQMSETAEPAALLRLMSSRLNMEEVRLLCFQLNINTELLAGDGVGLRELLVALLTYLKRHGRTAELLATLRQERPDVEWPHHIVERDDAADELSAPDRPGSPAFHISGNIQAGIVNVGGVQHFDQPIQIDMRKSRPSRDTDEEDEKAS
jgi:hypothetical protein